MEFTPTQLELLFGAWLLARENPPQGAVVADDCYPDAHELAEGGWLERGFVGESLVWFWTPQAEAALRLSAMTDLSDRMN